MKRRVLVLRDLYHFLLNASWRRLLASLAFFYVAGNALFALLYVVDPGGIAGAEPGSFRDAFFFSVQTLATIGYGAMSPRSLYVHLLVTVEAFVGIVGVAMVTGLVFAKFSRPTARVLFSHAAIVTTRDGVPSFMFRMANERNNNIVEAQLHVVFARDEVTAEGESVRRFYDLDLARPRTALFVLSWTAVHPIGASSPLQGATRAMLAGANAEVIASLTGFDETFSQTIHARHVYRPEDIVWQARFVDVLIRGSDGRRHVDYRHFHDVVRIEPSEEG